MRKISHTGEAGPLKRRATGAAVCPNRRVVAPRAGTHAERFC